VRRGEVESGGAGSEGAGSGERGAGSGERGARKEAQPERTSGVMLERGARWSTEGVSTAGSPPYSINDLRGGLEEGSLMALMSERGGVTSATS
jgi:hypothetical protein